MHRWLICLLLLAGCKALPPQTQVQCERIMVGDGPEDMVIDDLSSEPRLLISCNDRRNTDPQFGEIVAYYPVRRTVDTLPRREEPEGLVFNPHGIDIEQLGQQFYLFVISHDDKSDKHTVIKYVITDKALYWVHTYESPHFRSPNALTVLEDGSFFVSNDRYNRDSRMEMILGKKKSTVVHCTAEGECTIAAEEIAMANGMGVIGDQLYLAATRDNKLFRYRIDGPKLVDRKVIAEVVGPDNIRFDESSILLPCHLRGMAFVRHAKKAKKNSPSVVYRIRDGQEPEVVFSDREGLINASSTALVYEGKMYISQVFEPWIVVFPVDVPVE